MTVDIQILYEGDDITADVEIRTARFMTQAGPQIGQAQLRVRDKTRTYATGYFHAGGVLELYINGSREWDGWVMTVDRQWAFDVEDTTVPDAAPRWWALTGYDRNLLFTRRYHYDKADPASVYFGSYPADSLDRNVILDVLANYTDLDQDGIDIVSGITSVGPIDPYSAFKAVTAAQALGQSMARMALQNGALFFIDPDRVFRYVDDQSETAPFRLSDEPQAGEVGYREMLIADDASQLANDALIWGAGMGSPDPVFGRATSDDSVALHGLFQYAEVAEVNQISATESAVRRADTYVNGSPAHERGHKEDQTRITCSIFEPGLRVGMGVSFHSGTWDFGDLTLDPGDLTPSPGSYNKNTEFERFLVQIGKIESNDTYTRQNKRSGAYGRWQVMPGNWRVWGPLALGLPRSSGVAARYIDPSAWVPEPTPANQDIVVRWRMTQIYNHMGGDPRRAAAYWRSGPRTGHAQPNEWSNGTILYVNHACVPLGYDPVTTSTILSAPSDPTASRTDFQQLNNIDDVVPVRKLEMTFPTENSVRFDLMLSHSYDAAWASHELIPGPNGPGSPFTQILYAVPDITTEPQPTPYEIDYTAKQYLIAWDGMRRGIAGEGTGLKGIYSSVGITNGFANNVSWPHTTCGLGPGGWTGWEDAEAWYRLWNLIGGKPVVEANAKSAILINMGTARTTGYVKGLILRATSESPGPGKFSSGRIVATIDVGNGLAISYPPHPYSTPGMTVEIPPVLLAQGTLTEDDNYLVLSPGWTSARISPPDYWCDPGYAAYGNYGECYARGPACSGQGSSGVFALDSAPLMTVTPVAASTDFGWSNLPDAGTQNAPATFWAGGQYRTVYPYIVGSLQITWQGLKLTRGVDYFETDPVNGIFTLAELGSGEDYMVLAYMVPAGAGPTDPLPGEGTPITPIPGQTTPGTGRVYRPHPQSQFGWGTPWDGQNCNMAAAAMAMDRHTLGAFSDSNGSPLATAPNMRTYSGRTGAGSFSRVGTTLEDARTAWNAGWGQSLLLPGPVSFEYLVTQLNLGRGAIVHGLETALPAQYREDNWPDAHAIYVNEQLSDGSFWIVDPLRHYGRLYPYDVLRAYATSLHNYNDVVTCAFTQRTPIL